MFSQSSEELSVGFGNLWPGRIDGQDGGIARMDRGNEGDLGAFEVGSRRHDDSKVAVGSAATGGIDGFSVGVKLLGQQLEGAVGGLGKDGGEKRMRKSERRRRGGRKAHGRELSMALRRYGR